MRRIKGFKLGKRLVRATKWVLRKNRTRPGYIRLNHAAAAPKSTPSTKPMSKLITWAKSLCHCSRPGSGYAQIGHEPVKEKEVAVPKGHLAVYVGQKDGDFQRVLVPVIYFNHPLFGELLRESEEEFGFEHQGGITIPCPISDFERVQTRIAAGSGGARRLTWKRQYWERKWWDCESFFEFIWGLVVMVDEQWLMMMTMMINDSN